MVALIYIIIEYNYQNIFGTELNFKVSGPLISGVIYLNSHRGIYHPTIPNIYLQAILMQNHFQYYF